ncbi:hypothetical protein CEXT_523611 [Caerostris extrusa]|uniref:Uncharacterized protein n=1 Tax=Caerostris extrusa TaxID=172846 RepID=A0AAV4RD19_CAEEX|nr:hypothetical protein CEXT_523611 [Caerostris extrusa]
MDLWTFTRRNTPFLIFQERSRDVLISIQGGTAANEIKGVLLMGCIVPGEIFQFCRSEREGNAINAPEVNLLQNWKFSSMEQYFCSPHPSRTTHVNLICCCAALNRNQDITRYVLEDEKRCVSSTDPYSNHVQGDALPHL